MTARILDGVQVTSGGRDFTYHDDPPDQDGHGARWYTCDRCESTIRGGSDALADHEGRVGAVLDGGVVVMTESSTAQYQGSRFARSADGKTIHRASCHLAAGRAVPWRWADDKTDHDVAWQILGTSWLRACKRCMGGMADAL